jgi:histone acetyltransferase
MNGTKIDKDKDVVMKHEGNSNTNNGHNSNSKSNTNTNTTKEEKMEITTTTSTDELPFSRDEYAKNQEDAGLVSFRVVTNDGDPVHMVDLINLKNIFSTQLPKMPKEYIVRLVLDRNHHSMCLLKKNKVIGGICFRPFPSQAFAEIVFCAITSSEQVKGYGTRIMNHLKEQVKQQKLEYFLTFADNYAIGYFKKQGFTKQVSMPRERWVGYIKDYDGGTLMECRINHKVNYLDIPGMIKNQREAVYEKIKKISNSHSIFPGYDFGGHDGIERRKMNIEDIKGVKEAGWKPPTRQSMRGQTDTRASPQLTELQAKLGAVLKGVKNLKDAWPFMRPVNGKLVPDYYDIIKEPMDLETMGQRLNQYYYKTKDMFVHDANLIVNNCRTYNSPTTTYFRCADVVEETFQNLMVKLGI